MCPRQGGAGHTDSGSAVVVKTIALVDPIALVLLNVLIFPNAIDWDIILLVQTFPFCNYSHVRQTPEVVY